MKDYKFYIDQLGENRAGKKAFTDIVTVSIESDYPGGTEEEFIEHLEYCLADWYEGATVTYLKYT